MNLNKRSYSPPPLNPLELVIQVKVLLTEYLRTMIQVSLILQQMQMLQTQAAPNPKAKKRKDPSEEDEDPIQESTTRSTSNLNPRMQETNSSVLYDEDNTETTTSNKLTVSTCVTKNAECQPFMTPEPNKQYFNECECKANSDFWFNSMLFDEKVHQIEAIWAKRLFIDNNKTLCEQKYK